MKDSSKQTDVINLVRQDSEMELPNHPNEDTGRCRISSKGYSDCIDGVTKASCDKQKGYGYTVKWDRGLTCP